MQSQVIPNIPLNHLMEIELNGQSFIFPTTLMEFTLGQRIAFQKEQGDTLDAMASSIMQMEESFEREMEIIEFQMEKAFRTFSFFSRVPVDVLKESEFVDTILSIYFSSVHLLFEDENNLPLQQTFLWRGEEWELAKPELRQGDKMKFGEVIDSKQSVQNMHDLGKGHWETLIPLCAIFFRKKDEAYNKAFLYDDSERQQMMYDLPMAYALQVGFFLRSSLNLYIQTSLSSMLPESSKAVNMQRNTLNALGGFTS